MIDEKYAAILDSTEALKLPAPRLQFTWIQSDEFHKTCLYTLVIPLNEHDIRREGSTGEYVRSEYHVLVGKTNVTGGGLISANGVVECPYRDGAHARWDSAKLGNLPIYSVFGTDATPIIPVTNLQ